MLFLCQRKHHEEVMPYSPRPGCRHPLCPNIAEQSSSYCSVHKKPASEYESNRTNANKRGYDVTWQRIRRMKLSANPLCEQCITEGITKQAVEVHHIISIEDNPELRLVWDNLMSLCFKCHDKTKHKKINK